VRNERSDPVRVLIIDDEPDVLLLCRVNLEFAGHQVLEASSGERGLELATSERPDLIVLDVMLPERDGIAVLEELVDTPETRDTPVVLLTAKAQRSDQLRGWRAGAADYVTKPFSPLALTDTLERIARMTPEERLEHREESLARLASTG
jgi:two-component system alkaline phosphatase synthesis response regulator PhoP